MKIAFSFDISKKIGSGHFYRCLALGKNLKRKNTEIHFLLKGKIYEKAEQETKKNNFIIKYLKDNNINKIAKYLQANDIRGLVVDKPDLEIKFQKKIKSIIKLLIVIQDIPKKNYCDILLNQNYLTYTKTKYKILSIKNTKLLLGPKYFIKNDNFKKQKVKKNKKNFLIHIFYGGSANSKNILKVLKVILDLNLKNIKVECFTGILNSNYKKLTKIFKNYKFIFFYKNKSPSFFLHHLVQSDLAFGSAGVSLFERLYFGVPSIVTSISQNQINNAVLLKKKNKIIFLGNEKNVTGKKIKLALVPLLNDKKKYDFLKRKTLSASNEISKLSPANQIYQSLRRVY